MTPLTQRIGFKNIWVSDVHLGARFSAAMKHTNNLFSYVTAAQITLVGDIIDGYELNRRAYWPHTHEMALQQICALPQEGVRVVYIPGNHDIGLRGYLNERGVATGSTNRSLALPDAPGIVFQWHAIHEGRQGNYLVLHGDEGEHFSSSTQRLARIYDKIYYSLAVLSPPVNKLLAPFMDGYYPLTRAFQNMVLRKIDFAGDFQERQVRQAKDSKVQGIICGHVHYPKDVQTGGIHYLNSGSMQADLTFLAEDFEGAIKLVNWGDISRNLGTNVQRNSDVLNAAVRQYGARIVTTPSPFAAGLPVKSGWARVVPSRHARLIDIAINGYVSGKSPVPSAHKPV